jgi:hypothetical protein
MVQQFAGDSGYAGVAVFPPCLYSGTNFIYQREGDELTNIVVLVCALPCYKITRRTAAGGAFKGLFIVVILPVFFGLYVGGAYD